MAITVDAIYENGVLRPLEPLALAEHAQVRVTVEPLQPPLWERVIALTSSAPPDELATPSTAPPNTTITSTARPSGRSDPRMAPRTVFADSFYWIALVVPRDAFHSRVAAFSRQLISVRLVTTDEVLSEVLNHVSGLEGDGCGDGPQRAERYKGKAICAYGSKL